MDLKNCKVGVFIPEFGLRSTVTNLLWKSGAVVYATGDGRELECFLRVFNIGVVVVASEPTAMNGSWGSSMGRASRPIDREVDLMCWPDLLWLHWQLS